MLDLEHPNATAFFHYTLPASKLLLHPLMRLVLQVTVVTMTSKPIFVKNLRSLNTFLNTFETFFFSEQASISKKKKIICVFEVGLRNFNSVNVRTLLCSVSRKK